MDYLIYYIEFIIPQISKNNKNRLMAAFVYLNR